MLFKAKTTEHHSVKNLKLIFFLSISPFIKVKTTRNSISITSESESVRPSGR